MFENLHSARKTCTETEIKFLHAPTTKTVSVLLVHETSTACKLLVQFSQWCSVREHLRLESLVTLWKSTLFFFFPLTPPLNLHTGVFHASSGSGWPYTSVWESRTTQQPWPGGGQLDGTHFYPNIVFTHSARWQVVNETLESFFFVVVFPVDFIVLGLLTELRLLGWSRSYRGSILSRHLCKCNYCHGETAWLDHSSLWYLRL